MKKIELLAPAGDLERLKWACLYGADAIYIGGEEYSLRANAKNFKINEIKEACEYVHSLNKKLYVTVNMIFHNVNTKNLITYLKQLEECKVDAIIVADLFIIDLLKENNIKIPVHISTQQSSLNIETIKFYENEGIVERVVLGREASKFDIQAIRKQSDIELETFIHGAMCTSYSGRCVMSNYMTNRDANRGGCSQICRWDFDLVEDNKKTDLEPKFTMCSKDLSMIDHIGDLIDLGVSSLKIEGRMRSIYYVATILSIYRKVIDNYYLGIKEIDPIDKYILNRCANRDSCVQFFDHKPGESEQYYNGRQEISNQDFLGIVLDYSNDIATITQRNYFQIGDEIEVFGPNGCKSFKLEQMWDDFGDRTCANHPEEILKIKIPFEVKKNDLLRKKMVI